VVRRAHRHHASKPWHPLSVTLSTAARQSRWAPIG
jgi:hypothetical protein